MTYRSDCPTAAAAFDAYDAGDTQRALELMDEARTSGTPAERDLLAAADHITDAIALIRRQQQ